jgi:hypothetical protein
VFKERLGKAASPSMNAPAASNARRAEVTHILTHALTTGGISTGDSSYLAGFDCGTNGYGWPLEGTDDGLSRIVRIRVPARALH